MSELAEKKLCGVEFTNLSLADVLKLLIESVETGKKGYVVTPNPEICLEMSKNSQYRQVIDNAVLRLADGFGLQWADWFTSRCFKFSRLVRKLIVYPSVLFFALSPFLKSKGLKRCTGTDLMEKFLIWHDQVPVFLLGAKPGVAEEVVKEFPFANIVGTWAGAPGADFDAEAVRRINQTNAKVVFVAYGAPKQEFWMARNLAKLSNITLAVGVGGAFDFLAKKVKRAPGWMQKLGLEWFFRLVLQPWRLKRIWRAVVVFPWWVAGGNVA